MLQQDKVIDMILVIAQQLRKKILSGKQTRTSRTNLSLLFNPSMVRLFYGYEISTFPFRSSWIAQCRQSPRISLYSYPSARARCIRVCLSLGLLVLSWFSSGGRVVVVLLSSALLPELIQRQRLFAESSSSASFSLAGRLPFGGSGCRQFPRLRSRS